MPSDLTGLLIAGVLLVLAGGYSALLAWMVVRIERRRQSALPASRPAPAPQGWRGSTQPSRSGASDLERQLEAAMARYEQMTPAKQDAMWREQRRSWVRGEMLWAHPDMDPRKLDRDLDWLIGR